MLHSESNRAFTFYQEPSLSSHTQSMALSQPTLVLSASSPRMLPATPSPSSYCSPRLASRIPSASQLPPPQAQVQHPPPSLMLGSKLRLRKYSSASASSHLLYTSSRGPSRAVRSIWLDNRAQVVVEVPVEDAFKMWEDRERIPQWMPWIASVKVQEDRPELSKWTLRWDAFGQKIEVNWLARNLKPVPNQKLHWRSEDGLPNRGAVRFYKKGPSACGVEMTISYEVPDFLLPFAAAVGPLVEGIIKGDLERFAVYARKTSRAST